MRWLLMVCGAAVLQLASPSALLARDPIAQAVASPERAAANRVRDQYRHPVETLHFFEVKPNQTLIEFLPGNGWYTEILAPLLKARGHYVALTLNDPELKKRAEALYAGRHDRYGEAAIATVDFKTGATTLAPESADRLLTFRNVHNLLMADEGTAARVFAAFFAALKPGGILGVVDHRLPENADAARERTSGYVKRSTVIALAQAAGFQLLGESEINANPKDTADWPDGVWTLPPVLKLGDKDRDRYLAIGESDRMTLKFVKPRR